MKWNCDKTDNGFHKFVMEITWAKKMKFTCSECGYVVGDRNGGTDRFEYRTVDQVAPWELTED